MLLLLFGLFLLHIPSWFLFLFYMGAFSYTSRAGFITMCGVSLKHPMLASFLCGEFLLHIQYNKTLLPSVNILIARGMFCSAKCTHHTITPIINHLITTTTANKHPGKNSFIDKNMKNPTGIKLCISHKISTSREPPHKIYCPNKSDYKNYLQQIN